MEKPILLIPHFIECLLMIIAGGVIFNFSSRNFKLFLIAGVINAILVYLVRSVYLINKIPFGTHSLVLAVLFIVSYKFIFSIDFKIATATSVLTFALLFASEKALFPTFISLFPTEQIINNFGVYLILNILLDLPFIVIILWGLLKGRLQVLANGFYS